MSLLRLSAALLCTATLGLAASPAATSRLAALGADGRLSYRAYSERGDRLLDFSHCGYGGGGVALPAAEQVLRLQPSPEGDDTARIQAALDQLAQRPVNAAGLRGALLLTRGHYRISGALHLRASGLVLRGEGQGEDGTVLIATGRTQRALIQIHGTRGPQRDPRRAAAIVDDYVPVGARTFRVAADHRLQIGDTVYVDRHGNAAWISELGMDRIKGRPGAEQTTKQWTPFTLAFDRVITALDGDRVTIDAPLACAIDARWGGGNVVPYRDTTRVAQCGVENLRAVSEFDRSVQLDYRGQFRYAADEQHAIQAVSLDHALHCWVRDVTALHFYHGVVTIESGAKWVTVQDCTSLEPVSKIDGGRRYPFNVDGQLNLVLRARSDGARHAFVFGARVPGPNAFVDCVSTREFATSEPHHRWSVGGLYDNVQSDLAFQDRQWMGTGHGWAGANYVAWNTRGTLICQQPPTAQNFAIGHVGKKDPGAFPRPDGYWESLGQPVAPRSLYFQQLADRLGLPQ